MADNKFDENAGTNKLANVLSSRMKKEGESPLFVDFGEIQANGSLVTNTFPVPIPKGQYSICRSVSGLVINVSRGDHGGHTSGSGKHNHAIPFPLLKPGDRVLVVWVQSEAVVIDVIKNS